MRAGLPWFPQALSSVTRSFDLPSSAAHQRRTQFLEYFESTSIAPYIVIRVVPQIPVFIFYFLFIIFLLNVVSDSSESADLFWHRVSRAAWLPYQGYEAPIARHRGAAAASRGGLRGLRGAGRGHRGRGLCPRPAAPRPPLPLRAGANPR